MRMLVVEKTIAVVKVGGYINDHQESIINSRRALPEPDHDYFVVVSLYGDNRGSGGLHQPRPVASSNNNRRQNFFINNNIASYRKITLATVGKLTDAHPISRQQMKGSWEEPQQRSQRGWSTHTT